MSPIYSEQRRARGGEFLGTFCLHSLHTCSCSLKSGSWGWMLGTLVIKEVDLFMSADLRIPRLPVKSSIKSQQASCSGQAAQIRTAGSGSAFQISIPECLLMLSWPSPGLLLVQSGRSLNFSRPSAGGWAESLSYNRAQEIYCLSWCRYT